MNVSCDICGVPSGILVRGRAPCYCPRCRLFVLSHDGDEVCRRADCGACADLRTRTPGRCRWPL